jgi:hypothetical protein
MLRAVDADRAFTLLGSLWKFYGDYRPIRARR